MGTVEIFASNGECKWDGNAAEPEQPDRHSEAVREQLRQGLELFQSGSRNELHCQFEAVDATEHQYIARYHANGGERLVPDGLDVIAKRCQQLGWELREDGGAYGLLRSVEPVEPAVPLSDLGDRIDAGRLPVRLGGPDAETAIGVAQFLLDREVVDSVLVSRSGVTTDMPEAEVVLLPYEADRPGELLDGPEDPSQPSVDEAEQAVADLLRASDRPDVARRRLAVALEDAGISVSVAADRNRPHLGPGLGGTLGGAAGAALGVGLLTPPLAGVLAVGGAGSGALLGHWIQKRRRSPGTTTDYRADQVATTVRHAVEAPAVNPHTALEDRILGPYGFEVDRIEIGE